MMLESYPLIIEPCPRHRSIGVEVIKRIWVETEPESNTFEPGFLAHTTVHLS